MRSEVSDLPVHFDMHTELIGMNFLLLALPAVLSVTLFFPSAVPFGL